MWSLKKALSVSFIPAAFGDVRQAPWVRLCCCRSSHPCLVHVCFVVFLWRAYMLSARKVERHRKRRRPRLDSQNAGCWVYPPVRPPTPDPRGALDDAVGSLEGKSGRNSPSRRPSPAALLNYRRTHRSKPSWAGRRRVSFFRRVRLGLSWSEV